MANDVKIVLTAQDKASEGVNRVAGRLEALEKASSDVAARMDTIRNAIAGVVTVGAGVALSKQFIDMADSMALLQSRIKLATSGAAEFAQVQADLFALAQRNSVSLEEVSGAFSRLSDPVKRLGGSSKEAIGIIDALSKSLKISGASSQESAAAIAQFGQAMGSGKLQGDEFKSLAESAPRFMKALSEGSGIAAENLKQMASDGKLTADVVGNALLTSLEKLNAEAAQMPDTVGQAMTRLKNDIAKAVDEINQAGGINGGLAGMIGDAGQLIGPIKQEMIEAFQAVSLWVENNRDGLIEIGRVVGGVVADVWRMAEAMASVAGFVADVSAKSGGLKTVLESVRIILAGIEDGITIIGAAFVKVGADVVDVLYKPLGNLMLAYGNALDMLGSSSAGWWQETGDRIRNTTAAAHEYADGVHDAFANQDSALGRLNAQLESNVDAQAEAGSAAATAGVALVEQGKAAAKAAAGYAKLHSSIKGDDDKGKGADPYQSLLENLRRQLAGTEKLNAVEKLNVELQEQKYAKLTALQKSQLQAVAAQIDAQQRLLAVRKLDDADEASRVDWIKRHGKALADEEQALWDKVEAQLQANRVIGLSKTATEDLTLADMEQQLAWRESLNLNDDVTESLKRRIAAQKQLVYATQEGEIKQSGIDAAKAAADAHKKAAEQAAAEWQKVADRIDQSFHDGFVRALESSGNEWDAFVDSMRTSLKAAIADALYQITARPIVLSIVGAFAGGSGAAVQAGSASPVGNGLSIVSGAQTAWAGINGGISNAAAAFAKSGFGQAVGLSTAPVELAGPTMTGEALTGTALTGAGATFAAAAGPVLGALAATYAIAEMQKSGWGSDNTGKNYAKDFALFGGTAGVVVFDRLFGHNRTVSNDAQGITGTFDLSGFEGQNYQERSQKGGTFRSDRRWTDYSAIGSDMDKALDSMLKQAVSGVQTIGKALNVETENALQGFSHTFALQLSENGDMSKAGEKIAAEIKKVQDELATRLVPNISDFARYGESASDTFSRLNQEVAATDAILLAMGKNASEAFGAVGLASIKAREDLIDLAGGLDKLASKTQSFYQHFYTSDEQVKLAAKQAQKVLDAGFADLNISQPTDKKGFRDLVEKYGSDLSTDSARKFFNALLDLEDEFYAVSAAVDAATEANKTAQQSQATLFDTFASDAQKLDAAKKLVGDTFASIGRDVPASASAFLQLAQSIDPATEAGQQMIAALAKVSNAFAYVQTSAASAAEAAKAQAQAAANAAASAYFSAIDSVNQAASLKGEGQSAIDALFGSIGDQAKAAAEAQASAAAEAAQAWKSATQSIKSALDNLRSGSLSTLSPEARYRMLQAEFQSTATAAQSGDSAAAGKLGQIATDFLQASKDYNASSEAFQSDRAAADAALSKSLQYAQAQVSTQDVIANASRSAVTELQSLNTNLSGFAKQALEMLQKGYAGVDRAGATDAVGKLAQMQSDFDKWFSTTKQGDSASFDQGTFTRLGDNMASFVSSSGAVDYLRANEGLLDIAKRIPAIRDAWEKQYGVKLPSYAVGTAYVPEDQIAQIHRGEMIIPAAAAAQLRRYGMSNQVDSGLQREIIDELRANRACLQQGNVALQQQLSAANAKLGAMEKRLAAVEDQSRLTRQSL